MTNLDDLTVLRELDPAGMLGHAAALPQQCRGAWALTRDLKLPDEYLQVDKVLIAGMGGSAIGGDLAAAVVADRSPLPVWVHRDYDLPAFADRKTLVIASSYSGDTEETVSAFRAARDRGCPLVAIATGGKLAGLAAEWKAPLVSFGYRSMPRAALGYLFVSLLGVLRPLGVTGDLEPDLEEALQVLEKQWAELAPAVPQAQNQAKRLAVELAGRVPVVVGAGPLATVIRRWKTQFNENGKSWAYLEPLPEMNHNAVSGTHFPAEMAGRVLVLFLEGTGLHPRLLLRLDLTRQVFEGMGIACRQVPIRGQSTLAQMLSAIQLGDTISCYLAALNRTDPTAIEDIVQLKKRMSKQ
jgi:glucose/mannose-6-phosphate isomerase